jgi:hypothetical protein
MAQAWHANKPTAHGALLKAANATEHLIKTPGHMSGVFLCPFQDVPETSKQTG